MHGYAFWTQESLVLHARKRTSKNEGRACHPSVGDQQFETIQTVYQGGKDRWGSARTVELALDCINSMFFHI
jgi:hypothetical protein